MNKFKKNEKEKYIDEKYEIKECNNGIIKYCIQNAYQKVIKLPFYKNPTFLYSDFEDSIIEKIIIQIYQYDYVSLHIYFNDEDEYNKNDKKEIKLDLYMYDKDILNKNIINTYDLCKYKYMKIGQKYLYYICHTIFYIIYAYYIIQLLFGNQININNLFILHFLHFLFEIAILNLL